MRANRCKFCGRPAPRGRHECDRCRQKHCRERHPVAALWHAHKQHAKDRGIPVLWDFFEFGEFCRETGYHILVTDGYTIDRREAHLGYSRSNCTLMLAVENSAKGARERWAGTHWKNRAADPAAVDTGKAI
jgi:hypothetical protein